MWQWIKDFITEVDWRDNVPDMILALSVALAISLAIGFFAGFHCFVSPRGTCF